jgi:hypothetical protein
MFEPIEDKIQIFIIIINKIEFTSIAIGDAHIKLPKSC